MQGHLFAKLMGGLALAGVALAGPAGAQQLAQTSTDPGVIDTPPVEPAPGEPESAELIQINAPPGAGCDDPTPVRRA